MNEWLKLAVERPVLLRGFRAAIIVGPILILLNHGDTLLYGSVTAVVAIKMILTTLVPFCVSVYSSVSTIIRRRL
jgi:hypothetical protein